MARSGLAGGARDDVGSLSSPPAARFRRPSWLDLRLVTGILLVLLSVVVGARIVAAADETRPMWAVTSDLAAGTTLTEAHLVAVRMRVSAGEDRYFSAQRPATGLALTRDVGAGELLPAAAVRERPEGSLVSIPVNPRHVPPTIRAGQRVDVYATTTSSDEVARTERILEGVTVEAVRLPPPAEMAVVVRVPDATAAELVTALRSAEIDVTVVSATRARP
jgi:hypothetical protein